MTEGARVREALLKAIARLDDEGALAVYNALAAHAENEAEHVSDLKDSPTASDRDEAPWSAHAKGGTLSHAACKANAGRIARAIRGDAKRADVDPARFYSTEPDWRVVAAAVNWEDREMMCAETGERIPSAYAED